MACFEEGSQRDREFTGIVVASRIIDADRKSGQDREVVLDAQNRDADKDNFGLMALRDQRSKLQQQIEFVIDELSALGKDAAKQKIRHGWRSCEQLRRNTAPCDSNALGTLIDKLDVDLFTRQARIALRLPDWALKPEKTVEALAGLDEKFLQSSFVETQILWAGRSLAADHSNKN